MIEFNGNKCEKPVIVFTLNDILFEDEFVTIYIKTNGFWRMLYPPEWSFEQHEKYYDHIKNAYDWSLIYKAYENYERAIMDQPDRSKREDHESGCGTQNIGDKPVREVQ